MIERHLIRVALIALLGGHALTAAMTAPAAAQAPGPPAGHEPGMHRPMGRTDGDLWLLIRSANLTPEQQTKVREILSAHRSTARPLIEQLRQAQQELGAKLLAPGAVQSGDIEPLLLRIGQLRDNLALDSAQAVLEVRAVLTPEQIARAAQTRERLRQLRDEMRQLTQPAR
ncbi:MAG TPA: periplasmic heavy metal sensor [Methylomirabilota bacterium]|nr:periplasmic heavy metal sensor [Methylomirabilota bacterium]